ncbi:uncharacterized mitochondrial protein-like protein [Tanacetum coccineum]
MDPYNQTTNTSTKLLILDTGKFEQWKFRIQQYLQHEHYALWEVIEFGDSYKVPPEEPGKAVAGEASAKKKGRIVAITTEDMQKRRNDVKARTTLLLALPDEHQLQAIVSHLEFMDVPIEKDDLNQKILTSLAPEWLMYTIVWRNRDDLNTMSLDDFSGKGEVPTASCQVSTISTEIDEDDIEEMDIRWNLALLSIRADSYMANEDENHALVADDVVPTEFALMAMSSSSSSSNNKVLLIWETREKLLRPQLVGFGNLRKILLVKGYIDDKGYCESGCSRPHDWQTYLYLSVYEHYDEDICPWTWSVSQIYENKNSVLFTDSEFLVLGKDFKLVDDTHVLLRTPRQHNMYSIDLNNIVPHKNLTCLIAKASVDESMLWHRRCDNGGEFRNREMDEFCSKKGIKREFSNARTPQQNGVAERRNRTLIEAARTISLAIGFLRPFGCHVMILNTLDRLGKFDAKGDEGTSSTNILGTKEDANQAVKDNVSSLRFIALPNWFHDAHMETSNDSVRNSKANDESSGNTNPTASSKDSLADQVEHVLSPTMESEVPTVSSPVLTAIPTVSTPIPTGSKSIPPITLSLPKIISRGGSSYSEPLSLGNVMGDFFGDTTNSTSLTEVEADISNMETDIQAKNVEEQSFIAIIHQKTNPDLLQYCLFSCFLSQEEPKKIVDALKDESWVEAMQEELLQFQIQNVWVLVDCPKEVYVMQPSGFEDPEFPDKVYRVEKAMYVLHQEPRAWYGTLSKYLLANGFQRVLQKNDGIFILQDKYVGDILKKFGYTDVRTAKTSMDKENPWGKDGPGKDVDLHLYRSMIRSLMYLSASRPDIMFAVCVYARYQVTPKECHLHAVKRTFRYLKGKPLLGLWYPKESPFDLVAYSDSNYNGDNQDRKSTTRGCQFLGRRLISWQCKKQTIMATATTEAEYVAAANSYGQVLWIQNQLLDYGYNFMNTKIYIENNSAICIVKNPVYHLRTKHIDIRHHFIRDCYEKKLINVDHIHTDNNVADLLTKPFDVGRF